MLFANAALGRMKAARPSATKSVRVFRFTAGPPVTRDALIPHNR
jgi:hypothetical protein